MTTSKTVKTTKCDHCNITIKKEPIRIISNSSFGDMRLFVGEEQVSLNDLDFCSEKCLHEFFTKKIAELKNE